MLYMKIMVCKYYNSTINNACICNSSCMYLMMNTYDLGSSWKMHCFLYCIFLLIALGKGGGG